jgi:hypothetical protein
MSEQDDDTWEQYGGTQQIAEELPKLDAGAALGYGLNLLGYIFVYHVFTGILLFVASLAVDYPGGVGRLAAGFLAVLSVLVYIAGTFGILYKIIADAVAVGTMNARAHEATLDMESTEGTEPSGSSGSVRYTGDPEVETAYDEDSKQLMVLIEHPGNADFVDVMVDGETCHTFGSPEPGDSVTVDKEPSESLEIKKRSYG